MIINGKADTFSRNKTVKVLMAPGERDKTILMT